MAYSEAARIATLKYKQKNREKFNELERKRISNKRKIYIDYTHEIQRIRKIDITIFI